MTNLIKIAAMILFAVPVFAQESDAPTKTRQKVVSLFYSFSAKADVKGDVEYLGQNPSFDGEYELSGAPGISISFQFRENKWAIDTGLAYEISNKIKSGKINMSGTTTSSASDSKITVALPYLNSRYYASEKLYFYAGFNFPIFNVSGESMHIDGEIGAQVGFGHQINERVNVDLQYRMISGKGKSTDDISGNIIKIDYDSLDLNGLVLSVGYSF